MADVLGEVGVVGVVGEVGVVCVVGVVRVVCSPGVGDVGLARNDYPQDFHLFKSTRDFFHLPSRWKGIPNLRHLQHLLNAYPHHTYYAYHTH